METGIGLQSVRATIAVGALLLAVLLPDPARAVTVACSEGALRDAVSAANAGTGDTTIVVPGDCTITLSGVPDDDANVSGDLDITASMTIEGAGPGLTVIDGGGVDRVFEINPGTLPGLIVTISGLTIRNGAVSGGGGGILNDEAFVTVRDSVVSGNTATLLGGGVTNLGESTLTVLISTISGNSSTGGAGGGGIYNGETLTVTDSTISGNSATAGNNNGGGIFNSGAVTLTRSTISGNTAVGTGSAGGIRSSASGSITMTNATISGNSAPSDSGTAGAIRLGTNASDSGTVTAQSSTIHGNVAPNGVGLLVAGAGDIVLKNTLVSGNTGVNCGVAGGATGAIVSNNPNLDTGASCGFDPALGDLVNTDPLLGPLANNAGVTQTHALLPASPAVDAGANPGCPATDQRGVPRPLDGNNDGAVACDIGAYERILVDDGLALGIALNQPNYGPGDTLTLDVTAANPTGPKTPVDAYLGFVLPASAGSGLGCPGGNAIAFLTAGLVGFEIHCVSDSVSAFPRMIQQARVPAALPPVFVNDFLATVAPPGLAPGTYTVFLVLTVPNAFVDGEVGPEDIIRVAIASFTIP